MNDRRRQVSIVVAAALVLVLAWLGLRQPAPAPGKTSASPEAGGPEAAFTAESVPNVISGVLRRPEGESFDRPRHNPFVFERSPEELAKEEAAAAESRKRATEEAERRRKDDEERARRDAEAAAAAAAEVARRPAPPPQAPSPPEFKYRFVGLIGPRGDALALLADGGGKLVYARAGDTIDAAFRVERVGKLNLDISFTDARFAGEVRQVQRVFKDAVGAGTAPPSTRRPSGSRRN